MTLGDILCVLIASYLGSLLAIWIVIELRAHATKQQHTPKPPDDGGGQPAPLPCPSPEPKPTPGTAIELHKMQWEREFEEIVRQRW